MQKIKLQDLCCNPQVATGRKREKRGQWGTDNITPRRVVTPWVGNAENTSHIQQFRWPAKLGITWASIWIMIIMEYNTNNTKIIHEFIRNSRKGLGLGLGGKAFLYKTMPANVEEEKVPKKSLFCNHQSMSWLSKGSMDVNFRWKLDGKQYSWSLKASVHRLLTKGMSSSLGEVWHHLPQLITLIKTRRTEQPRPGPPDMLLPVHITYGILLPRMLNLGLTMWKQSFKSNLWAFYEMTGLDS